MSLSDVDAKENLSFEENTSLNRSLSGTPSKRQPRMLPKEFALEQAHRADVALERDVSSQIAGNDAASVRLSELQAFAEQMRAQLQQANLSVKELESSMKSVSMAVASSSSAATTLSAEEMSERDKEMERVLRGNRELQEMLDAQRAQHCREMEEWARRLKSLESQVVDEQLRTKEKAEEAESRAQALENQAADLEDAAAASAELEQALALRRAELDASVARAAALERELANARAANDEMQHEAHEHEKLRKRLHNTIQELKGNIRVFCRVRPLVDAEGMREEPLAFAFPDELEHRQMALKATVRDGVSGNTASKTYDFEFDRVFAPEAPQGAVFDEISQLVQSALDGYNTCIFAYGQTGSGKTYTMEGAGGLSEARGMIPRAVEQIFATAARLARQGWRFAFKAQFLEIYNEKIRDLLAPEAPGTQYEIKHDLQGNTTVTNMTTVSVDQPEQVYELLGVAARNRATEATLANERSSRSHSVFRLLLDGENDGADEQGGQVHGILNLVDLAGSERLSVSGATGDRLTETKNINRSLACLGDVIFSLASKSNHTPYRNSKLTYLLQHSLGGNSKTLMFVNISPLTRDLSETLSSLRFAMKVNSVEIGKAKKMAVEDTNAAAANPTNAASVMEKIRRK